MIKTVKVQGIRSENHESALIDKIITHYVLRKNTFQLILEDELDL